MADIVRKTGKEGPEKGEGKRRKGKGKGQRRKVPIICPLLYFQNNHISFGLSVIYPESYLPFSFDDMSYLCSIYEFNYEFNSNLAQL